MSCIHFTVPWKLPVLASGAARAGGCQSIPKFQGRCGAPMDGWGTFFLVDQILKVGVEKVTARFVLAGV